MEISILLMGEKIRKKHYRCHAHSNPFSTTGFEIPESPNKINWKKYFENGNPPSSIDIGCGYGKFLMETAKQSPDENILGLEIRSKVVEYVKVKSKSIPNCAVIRTNAMLFLLNYFSKGTLERIFVLFPDPHFKKRKQKARMISMQMMPIFKYLLSPNGKIYISTDVKELFADMCSIIEKSGYFVEDESKDELLDRYYNETDESHRAGVKTGVTFGSKYKII